MRRYWLPETDFNTDPIVLKNEVYHHICNVCRQDLGSKFELIVNNKAYLVEIFEKNNKQAKVKVIEERIIPDLPLPHMELAVSIPKFSTFENIIEKAVELGVKRIRPFYSEFSFIRSHRDDIDHKKKRWEKIVLQATQQSGRGDVMEILDPVPMSTLLESFKNTADAEGIFAYEGETAHRLGDALTDLNKKNGSVWLFVGSEGGFSYQEVEYFQKFNLKPVTLGQQVLRVETACVTLVAVLKYVLGQMR